MNEGYIIREYGYHANGPRVSVEVDYLEVLPTAMRRLVEMGYDLNDTLIALQNAITEKNRSDAAKGKLPWEQ